MLVVMFFLVLVVLLMLVQGVAFSTLRERYLLGGSQQRLGPNKVSFVGLLQPIADGVKLVKKEQFFPSHSSGFFFVFVPGIVFLVMCLEWFVLDFFFDFFTMFYGVLLFLCLMGFSVYGFLLGGVVRKSKYGLLGALRAGRQRVSYEIVFRIFVICVVNFWGGYFFLCGRGVVFVYFFLPFFFLMLGELNRAPFDFSEGERELVSGYNIEFGSISYVLYYMGEYGGLLFFRVFFSLLFFNCRFWVFYFVFCLLVFVRRSFPRFRYDMMMGFF